MVEIKCNMQSLTEKQAKELRETKGGRNILENFNSRFVVLQLVYVKGIKNCEPYCDILFFPNVLNTSPGNEKSRTLRRLLQHRRSHLFTQPIKA